MREIKFRGKARDGTWVFGYYVVAENLHYITSDKHIPHNSGFIGGAVVLHHIAGFREVDPKTIGQYTGLKDCAGKEIYEGDIVEYENGNAGYGRPREQEISRDVIPSIFNHFKHEDLQSWWKDGEIIGNAYDNPELLK